MIASARSPVGRFRLQQFKKAAGADFIANALDIVERHAIELQHRFDAHAPHQIIDVDKFTGGTIHSLPTGKMECYAGHRWMTNVFTTSRDVELLTSLVMAPLTTAQLLKLSETYAAGPFRSPRTLLDRLQRLLHGGFIQRFPLAIVSLRGGGLPHYYKLTPAGLRLLYGEEARPPSKQFFAPVAVARHYHTHALSQFLVATAVAAFRNGFRMQEVYPENTCILDVSGGAAIV